jgi:hypothetical protein
MTDHSASCISQKNDRVIKRNNGHVFIEEKKEHMFWQTLWLAEPLNDATTLI